MYYVTATDNFMSGWGMAEGKTNRVVIECESYDDALKVYGKLNLRNEMKRVNISAKMPIYDTKKYYVSLYDLANNSSWVG